ncbi:hypothetical protein [Pseudobacillus badius]|uniref:hypothetical protein n=1 Tax=Bacillus badius TaxID=1455 RepID=UPI003D336C1C
MHYYLKSTEDATIELFSAYEVAKAQWREYALHKGQWGYISNHHKKSLDSDGMIDSERERITNDMNKAKELSEKYRKEAEIHDVTRRILAGSILQLAKQGLSIVFGQTINFPQEPKIEDISVATIILAGRNQSMHYEEGNYKNVIKSCFEALAQIDSKFALQNASGKNMSIEILDMLGWDDYESYIATMEDLLNR